MTIEDREKLVAWMRLNNILEYQEGDVSIKLGPAPVKEDPELSKKKEDDDEPERDPEVQYAHGGFIPVQRS